MADLHYGILEAENFVFTRNFEKVSSSGASANAYAQAAGSGPSSMYQTVKGAPGVYDVVVSYWDEGDGTASSQVKVDGQTIASWDWNKKLGSANANPDTYTKRVIRDVTLDNNATIVIEGERDGKEPLRIDKVELLPAASRDLEPGLDAFPGAEGFGSDTPGGRGGWIVKVTNLNDSGPGSLRWALEDLDVPRIVVFEVGGLITLKDEIHIRGNVTVAGQTAPGDGITIRGGRLEVAGDDVIIRGLKVRPGDGSGQKYEMRDAISVGSSREIVENVIIDSNSFSWATDEVASTWNGARHVTYSNNIIAEALYDSKHPSGTHSMGMLIGDDSRNITVVNNLFANNYYRNPTVAESKAIEFVNNYVYGVGEHSFSVTMRQNYHETAHIIGNYFEAGPQTHTSQAAVRLVGETSGGAFYLKDNLSWDRTHSSQPEKDVAAGALAGTVKTSLQFTPSDVKAMAARDVPDYVLANAGARAQGLDDTDTRILNNVESGRGKIIDSPSQVGGYDAATVYSNLKDTDEDGIPDVYEDQIGSNKTLFDPHGDANRDGYSNIENYINGLISGSSGSSGGSAGSAPDSGGGAPQQFAIEAEDLDIIYGFAKASSVNASGRALLQHVGGSEARAEMAFTGASGVYDIKVRYVDETDGVSRLAVQVDGQTVDEWSWNKTSGSSIVTPDSFFDRVIQDVELDAGDVVSLVGSGDGGEPLRIDGLEFWPDLG